MIDELLEYVGRIKAEQAATNTGPTTGHLNRICGEVEELKAAVAKGSTPEIKNEFGDVLMDVLFAGYELGIEDPIACAWGSAYKVNRRMEYVQNRISLNILDVGYRNRADELWGEAKEVERLFHFNQQVRRRARQETPNNDTDSPRQGASRPGVSYRSETSSSPIPSQVVGAPSERCYHQQYASRTTECPLLCDAPESSSSCT